MDYRDAAKILATTIADDPTSLGGYHNRDKAIEVANAMTLALGEEWWAKEIRGRYYLTDEDKL